MPAGPRAYRRALSLYYARQFGCHQLCQADFSSRVICIATASGICHIANDPTEINSAIKVECNFLNADILLTIEDGNQVGGMTLPFIGVKAKDWSDLYSVTDDDKTFEVDLGYTFHYSTYYGWRCSEPAWSLYGRLWQSARTLQRVVLA